MVRVWGGGKKTICHFGMSCYIQYMGKWEKFVKNFTFTYKLQRIHPCCYTNQIKVSWDARRNESFKGSIVWLLDSTHIFRNSCTLTQIGLSHRKVQLWCTVTPSWLQRTSGNKSRLWCCPVSATSEPKSLLLAKITANSPLGTVCARVTGNKSLYQQVPVVYIHHSEGEIETRKACKL